MLPMARQGIGKRVPGGAEGGSMVIILLALLGILIAAGTLVSRATQGQLGGIANSQVYGARKAAEAGISRLIAEFNQRQNRMLLASGSPASTWQPSTKWLRNPCTTQTISLDNATPLAGTDLDAYRTGAWIQVVSGDTERRYRLRRVTFRKRDRNISTTKYTQTAFGTDSSSVPSGKKEFPNMSANTATYEAPKPFTLGGPPIGEELPQDEPPDSHGYLEVEVEGQVLQGATVLASGRVVKEFQVVPKCCKRSFGKTLAAGDPPKAEIYGNDWRGCDPPSGLTPGQLAVLTGLNGGGLELDNGNSWSLRVDGTSPPKKVDPIICTTPAGTCDGPDKDTVPDDEDVVINSTDGNIGVTAFNITIPDPPLLPSGMFSVGPGSPQLINGGGALKSESITPQDDGVTNVIKLPSLGLQQSSNTKYCGYKSGAFHCRISSIKLPGNKTIEVDTTAAPVYLYLQDPTGTIDIKGTAGLTHVYNGSPAPAMLSDRLRILGEPRNGTPSSQTFELSGDSVNTSMFIWAPVANLSLGGNSTYRGITWVDNLGFFGNANVTVPKPNGTDDTCPELLPAYPEAVYCRLLREIFAYQIPLAFDWVARSETFTRFYGAGSP
jgi:hypothetical protein